MANGGFSLWSTYNEVHVGFPVAWMDLDVVEELEKLWVSSGFCALTP